MTTRHQLLVGAILGLALIAHDLVGTAQGQAQRTFAKPEDAVRALIDATKAGSLDGLRGVFGPDSEELISSSDAATAQANREVFNVAVAEGWRLVDQAGHKTLVIG